MSKKYAVVGLGFFGRKLAKELAAMGHQILAIDNSEDAVAEVQDHVDKAIIGDVTQPNLFSELLTEDFEAIIVTMATNLEASLLSVLHARENGISHVIAKSSGSQHTTILRRLGVDEIIMPEEDIASRLARQIGNPRVHEYMNLEGDHSLMEVAVPEKFVGKSLTELNLRDEYNLQVIGVKRKNETSMNYVPSPNVPFEEGDEVMITGPEDQLKELSEEE